MNEKLINAIYQLFAKVFINAYCIQPCCNNQEQFTSELTKAQELLTGLGIAAPQDWMEMTKKSGRNIAAPLMLLLEQSGITTIHAQDGSGEHEHYYWYFRFTLNDLTFGPKLQKIVSQVAHSAHRHIKLELIITVDGISYTNTTKYSGFE